MTDTKDLIKRYEQAIQTCDGAWSQYLEALNSGFASELNAARRWYRKCYADKVTLWREILSARGFVLA